MINATVFVCLGAQIGRGLGEGGIRQENAHLWGGAGAVDEIVKLWGVVSRRYLRQICNNNRRDATAEEAGGYQKITKKSDSLWTLWELVAPWNNKVLMKTKGPSGLSKSGNEEKMWGGQGWW